MAVASGSRGSVVDEKKAAERGGAKPSSGWGGADKPLAYSDVAHLGVDSVLFALVRCTRRKEINSGGGGRPEARGAGSGYI